MLQSLFGQLLRHVTCTLFSGVHCRSKTFLEGRCFVIGPLKEYPALLIKHAWKRMWQSHDLFGPLLAEAGYDFLDLNNFYQFFPESSGSILKQLWIFLLFLMACFAHFQWKCFAYLDWLRMDDSSISHYRCCQWLVLHIWIGRRVLFGAMYRQCILIRDEACKNATTLLLL